ncbi:MAG: hypothetical protein HY695_22925 [Deltaproteobacteria bacterium]|nr:hypothetical protein [Deltaproteobacteria bacterium]
MGHRFLVLAFVSLVLISCVRSVKHDEVLAGTRALQFAQAAFIQRDFQKSYPLLSDAAKRYVSPEKFKETLSRLHQGAYPTSLKADEYEPMPGEKALYVYLTGDNGGEQFQYMITMEGTASTDYKVSSFKRGGSYLPSGDKRKFAKPLRISKG